MIFMGNQTNLIIHDKGRLKSDIRNRKHQQSEINLSIQQHLLEDHRILFHNFHPDPRIIQLKRIQYRWKQVRTAKTADSKNNASAF